MYHYPSCGIKLIAQLTIMFVKLRCPNLKFFFLISINKISVRLTALGLNCYVRIFMDYELSKAVSF